MRCRIATSPGSAPKVSRSWCAASRAGAFRTFIRRTKTASNPLSSSRATGKHHRAAEPHRKTGKPYIWFDPETGERLTACHRSTSCQSSRRTISSACRRPLPLTPAPPEAGIDQPNAAVRGRHKRYAAYFKAGYEQETKELAKLNARAPHGAFPCRLLPWLGCASWRGRQGGVYGRIHKRMQKQRATRPRRHQGDRGDNQQRPRARGE